MPRITWDDLPNAVRTRVEEALGSPVVAHRSHPGGFSPGTADRVTCADGQGAFVKAVHPSLNPDSPDIHRSELRVMRALPAGLPVPALLAGFELDGWVVLVLEYVDGEHPSLPWRMDTLRPVLDAVLRLSDLLTPARLDVGPASAHCTGMWGGFARCLRTPPPDLDPWLAAHLPLLAARAERSLTTLDGETLAHFDLRADNVLMRTGEGPADQRVVLIDWPWALRAARWVDATLLVAEFAAQPDPASVAGADALLAEVAGHCAVDAEPLVDAIVGITGFLVWQSRQPPPPGLPTLRPFQRGLADGLTHWLAHTSLSA